MKIDLKEGDVTKFQTQLLVVNLFKGVREPAGVTGVVDSALGGSISRALKAGEMQGRLGETLVFRTAAKIPAERVLLLGLGDKDSFGPEEARRAAAVALWEAEKLNLTEMATIVHGAGIGGMNPTQASEDTALGSLLAAYRFDKYKIDKEKSKPRVRKLVIVEHESAKLEQMQQGILRAEAIAWGQNLARDLVNEPSNVMIPVEFASRVKEAGSELGLEVTSYDETWIKEKKMNLLWGVAKGSAHMPRLVEIKHKGAGDNDPWIALVGKGVMFDSGGISIKSSSGMEAMKGDMGGGAAVVGAMLAIAKLGIKKNVYGIVPAVMNSPGANAQNPGDVVIGMDGPSVEIISTDAEGRLILADALSYARELGASYLVDIATLTGASVVALGNRVAGIFPTDDRMRDVFMENVSITGEKLWSMPMFDEYKEQLKSLTAVIKNTGGRGAGAITAAKFLEYFTGGKPWVHIDIASKEQADKSYSCYRKGATGFGVRTLLRFVESW